MSIRIVQLGTARAASEGLRLGTVRKPPRGVPRAEFGSRDYYDVWFPNLAPTTELMAQAKAAENASQWAGFVRRFRAQMAQPDTSRVLDVLAALSATANFSLGCYCDDEAHCHRSVLRELLAARGAVID